MAKILLIEDDQTTRELVSELLEDESYNVEAVDNGKSALDLLAVSQYDLIIVDWGLPDMTGIDLCKKLRRENSTCGILMLTGRSQTLDKQFGLDSGADDYITKPFEEIEFLARIRALLRRGTASTNNTFKIGDITIDTNKRLVLVNNKTVELKSREFDLLEFLARNRGIVYSLDQLIQHVWLSDEMVSHDAVRQCVKRIRKKISIDNKESIIRTMVGAGYKIE